MLLLGTGGAGSAHTERGEPPEFYRSAELSDAMDLDNSSAASDGIGPGIKPGEIWIPELVIDDMGSARRGVESDC